MVHSELVWRKKVVEEVHQMPWEAMAALDRELQALRLVMVVEEAQDHGSAVQVAHFVGLRTVEAPRISARQLFLPRRVSLVVGEEEEAQRQGQAAWSQHAQACLHRRWVAERGMPALGGRVHAVR